MARCSFVSPTLRKPMAPFGRSRNLSRSSHRRRGRAARPERRRQDDAHPHAARPDHRRFRRGRSARHGLPLAAGSTSASRSASCRRTSACSRPWPASSSSPMPASCAAWLRRRHAAGPRGAQLRRPRRGPLSQGRIVFDRHEAAAQAGGGHRPRSASCSSSTSRPTAWTRPGGRRCSSWPATWRTTRE